MPILSIKFIETKPDSDNDRHSVRRNDITGLPGRLKGWQGGDFGGNRPNGNTRIIVINDVPVPAIKNIREYVFENLPDKPETVRQYFGRVDVSSLPAPKRAHLNSNGWVELDFNAGMLQNLIRRKKIIDIDDQTQDENEDPVTI